MAESKVQTHQTYGQQLSYSRLANIHRYRNFLINMLSNFRLKVMYQNMFLHSIEPNQFIDSPEYDMYGNCDTDETYQVRLL